MQNISQMNALSSWESFVDVFDSFIWNTLYVLWDARMLNLVVLILLFCIALAFFQAAKSSMIRSQLFREFLFVSSFKDRKAVGKASNRVFWRILTQKLLITLERLCFLELINHWIYVWFLQKIICTYFLNKWP